jgi:hypothetical protein
MISDNRDIEWGNYGAVVDGIQEYVQGDKDNINSTCSPEKGIFQYHT